MSLSMEEQHLTANRLQELGRLALASSRLDEAERSLADAVEGYRAVRFALGEADTLRLLADLARRRSDHDAATSRLAEAVAVYPPDRTFELAECDRLRAAITLEQGDYTECRTACVSAVARFTTVGFTLGQAECVRMFGLVELAEGRHDLAGKHADDAHALFTQAGSILGRGGAMLLKGNILLTRGENLAAAEDAYSQARTLFRQVGSAVDEANAARKLGDVAYAKGDQASAARWYAEACEALRDSPHVYSRGYTLWRLARTEADPERREQLLDEARAVWGSLRRPDLTAQMHREFGERTG